jgi:serine phosphatase RsbU (regulator of sigma subunit)/ABC-type amino acid transport substrate-binding protein
MPPRVATICLVGWALLAGPPRAVADLRVRVGVYPNEPVVFVDDRGVPSGVFADILREVARLEGWELVFAPGTWEECLARLRSGEIDLQPAIAWSEEREGLFAFTREWVLLNWGQVYAREDVPVRSFLDLGDRTLAAVRGDVYYDTLRRVDGLLGVRARYLEVDGYGDVFLSLEQGRADAGLVPRIFGAYHEAEHRIVRTSLMFGPTELRFAASKRAAPALIPALDRHLAALKAARNSVYHRSLSYWIEGARTLMFPRWLKPAWVIAGVGAVLLVVGAANQFLRWQVRRKTRELKETLAAQERIEGELRVAHEIQMSLVPREFPPTPGYEWYGELHPARAVGGDFYDVFALERDRICFVVGDVADKGIPAALLMASSRALARAAAAATSRPAGVMEAINRSVGLNNDACMFVTAFCGILSTADGELRYVNAGHVPPLLLEADGSPRFLEDPGAPALGIDPDARFPENAMTLGPGNVLLLYTDGVSEARGPSGEFLPGSRLREAATGTPGRDASRIVEDLLREVRAFSGEAGQHDDVAVLAVRRLPAPGAPA